MKKVGFCLLVLVVVGVGVLGFFPKTVLAAVPSPRCEQAGAFVAHDSLTGQYRCTDGATFLDIIPVCGSTQTEKDSYVFNPNTGLCVAKSTPPPSNDIPGCIKIIGAGASRYTDVPSLGCLSLIVTRVIQLAFVFLEAFTVLMILFGAVKMVFSQGDPKALLAAKQTVTYAAIGAVVVLTTFLIIGIITQILGMGDIIKTFSIYISPN